MLVVGARRRQAKRLLFLRSFRAHAERGVARRAHAERVELQHLLGGGEAVRLGERMDALHPFLRQGVAGS